jgi:O-antigen ligase
MVFSLRFTQAYQKVSDQLWRFVPPMVVVAITSVIVATQFVSPHRRMIKVAAVAALLAIMLKFEMIYSLYFFGLVFLFPTGIAITYTNVVLMTVLPMAWIVRANTEGRKVFFPTAIDKYVILLLLAYVVSFFNVTNAPDVIAGAKLVWRQLSACAFFYLIVRFVTNENKLENFTKVITLAAGVMVLTGLFELIMPGKSLIPWAGTGYTLGTGKMGYRVEGIRLGGAVGSHDLLSDYCSITFFFMMLHFFRAKNPFEKTLWITMSLATVVVMMATGNRGGMLGFIVGFVYVLFVLRRHFTPVRYVMVVAAVAAFLVPAQLMLEKYTVAESVTKRLMGTTFVGGVPETRVGVWEGALRASFDHIFIGHGPQFTVTKGLGFMFWPHNTFIYFLYTLGLFGAISFIIICVKIFRESLLYRSRAVRDKYVGTLLGVLHVQLVMTLIEQQRTDHQRGADYVYMYIVWMLFGLIVAAANVVRKEEKQLAAAEAADEEAESEPI